MHIITGVYLVNDITPGIAENNDDVIFLRLLFQFNRQLHGLLQTNRMIDLVNGDAARNTYLHDTKYVDFRPIKASYEQAFLLGGGAHLWKFETITEITHAQIATAVWGFLRAEGDAFLGAFDIPFDFPDESFMLDTKEWTDVDLVVQAAGAGISTITPEIGVVTEDIIP